MPGSSFVHNRLTHSLEVSIAGRSLGKLGGVFIADKFANEANKEFYKYELPNVIAAACLAHDIGNPAFGHSGENAISNYFKKNTHEINESLFEKGEWEDLTNFEGNANSFRILTNHFNGKLPGGQRLTYTTLASLIKYPCESIGSDDNYTHLKKYGFFQSEKQIFISIADELKLNKQNDSPLQYYRHPFVYLVEAADDITYTIIDLEDAHRLGIIEFEIIFKCLLELIKCIDRPEDNIEEINKKVLEIKNKNEKISYLRSRSINSLILEANSIFQKQIENILESKFNSSLFKEISISCSALEKIQEISRKEIYNNATVVQLELAGYNVMFELLSLLIPSAKTLEDKRDKQQKKALSLIPEDFGPFSDDKSFYEKCFSILDFISGMTDIYATELYRKIKGIEIGKHS